MTLICKSFNEFRPAKSSKPRPYLRTHNNLGPYAGACVILIPNILLWPESPKKKKKKNRERETYMDEIHKQNILKKGGCVVQNCEWKLKENYFVKKKKKIYYLFLWDKLTFFFFFFNKFCQIINIKYIKKFSF